MWRRAHVGPCGPSWLPCRWLHITHVAVTPNQRPQTVQHDPESRLQSVKITSSWSVVCCQMELGSADHVSILRLLIDHLLHTLRPVLLHSGVELAVAALKLQTGRAMSTRFARVPGVQPGPSSVGSNGLISCPFDPSCAHTARTLTLAKLVCCRPGRLGLRVCP